AQGNFEPVEGKAAPQRGKCHRLLDGKTCADQETRLRIIGIVGAEVVKDDIRARWPRRTGEQREGRTTNASSENRVHTNLLWHRPKLAHQGSPFHSVLLLKPGVGVRRLNRSPTRSGPKRTPEISRGQSSPARPR